ncbi:15046_t:CDS:1, partial [Funneliformis geosporum]
YKRMKLLYKFKKLVRDILTNSVISPKWSPSINELYTLLNEYSIPYVSLLSTLTVLIIQSIR